MTLEWQSMSPKYGSVRGYCGIGIVGSKTSINVGTLWRSAFILGAQFMFTAGKRFPQQASDICKSWKNIPYFEYPSIDELFKNIPKDCIPVAVEMDVKGKNIFNYIHPERAIYMLGSEDTGLPQRVIESCRDIIQIPGHISLNVATAGSIVLYDRLSKRGNDSIH